MPEGDSLYRFANIIRPPLAGQVIRAASAQGPGPVPQVHRVVGATCTGVRAVGKNILISLDNGLALRGHLRMYGTWHVYGHGEPWRMRKELARLVLETDTGVVVNFNAPVIELIEERALPAYGPIGNLGPNLLDDNFDGDEAFRRFRSPERASLTIGDAIMDQRIMAGVGNIWKHETLFRCGLNPWRLVGELDDEAVQSIIETAQQLLRASVHKSSRFGTLRPTQHVYMRAGQPCPRCYTRIQSSPQGADIRHTAWCPRCQPIVEGQAVVPRPRRGPISTGPQL